MANQFTWIPIYQELADELANWQNRQGELIKFLEDLRAKDYKVTPLTDKDLDGNRFLMTELDPFTFFGSFNRRIRDKERIAILSEIKHFFGLRSELPADFAGIPVLHPMSSWFIAFKGRRNQGDVERLWRVYKLALTDSPLENPDFRQAFNEALQVRKTNINLTMGLFWIRPAIFLNLDQLNRTYLEIRLPAQGLNAEFYTETLKSLKSNGKSFAELSMEAWQSANEEKSGVQISDSGSTDYHPQEDVDYWLVGAYWDDHDPADQTARFLAESVWENGYDNRFNDEVKSIKVGDKIAIKAAGTQRRNLPFNAYDRTVSRMTIKAIGTVVANRGDGRTVEVEWEQDFKEKNWYFFTSRMTLWHLRVDEDYRLLDLSEKLRDFIWYGKEQDYDWWVKRWELADEPRKVNEEGIETGKLPYSIEDMVTSGVFRTETELTKDLERLLSKKAMILQGPPGVGKTFIARKLAYALMKEVDDDRLEMVQFHQSYSYDDFVQGYRPVAGKAGNFGLQNGVFYKFCKKAADDPDHESVFIIDEINRGNLSQIFGELLMLIEHDKRGPDFAVPLIYQDSDEPRFYVPQNVYLIGLMNVADRSLAMVDYAVRRRFAFVDLKPQFENEMYCQWLLKRSMDQKLVDLIVERMSALNKAIREDSLLGENYQIGHSFFCPKGSNFEGLNREWYEGVVLTEIVPLLKEYWFDNQKKAEEAERRLLA